MSVSQPARSPLARLVLFMVCLSIAGAAAAAVHYYAIDLPAQAMIQPPQNQQGRCFDSILECMDYCDTVSPMWANPARNFDCKYYLCTEGASWMIYPNCRI